MGTLRSLWHFLKKEGYVLPFNASHVWGLTKSVALAFRKQILFPVVYALVNFDSRKHLAGS